jgi:hypothetical protein
MTRPIKKTARKAAPRVTVPPTPINPTSGDDDFQTWEDRQNAVTVERENTDDFPSGDENETADRARVKEVAPKIPTRTKSLTDRFRAAMKGEPVKRGPGRPRKVQPRVSVEKLISSGWMGLSAITQRVNMPVSRVLLMQAPVAGAVLEDAVKDTAIDKLLQPVARMGEGGEVAFALVAPPLLVGALTSERVANNPRMQMVLTGMLKEALKSWLKVAGPKIEEKMKEEEEFQEKYGMQIDVMIAFILGEPTDATGSPNGSRPAATVPTNG